MVATPIRNFLCQICELGPAVWPLRDALARMTNGQISAAAGGTRHIHRSDNLFPAARLARSIRNQHNVQPTLDGEVSYGRVSGIAISTKASIPKLGKACVTALRIAHSVHPSEFSP